MNKDEIIRMAREAGFEHIAEANYWHPLFKRFAALVAAAEREECAKVCEKRVDRYVKTKGYMFSVGAQDCADAIRAGRQK